MDEPNHMLLWPRLARQWAGLPAATRRGLVDAAAVSLGKAWRDACDLRAIPVHALAFPAEGASTDARLPAHLLTALPHPLSPPELRGVLAAWFNDVRAVLQPAEALRFLRRFLPHLGDDPLRYQARAIRRLADYRVRVRAAEFYRDALKADGIAAGDLVTGHWKPDPALRPAELLQALEAAAADPHARRIKTGPAISVMRSTLLGEDVIIKRYARAVGWRAWKSRGRPSRARRAWAAGLTLKSLGISTPEPLGFLEIRHKGMVGDCYVITRYAEGTVTAFRWLRRSYLRLDETGRLLARDEVRRALLRLYDAGVYHGDAKLTNLLLHTDAAGRRTWLWTDLECLDAGRTLSRRRLLRNLVQLNGSLRNTVPEAERLAFLRALARERPWLARPRVAALIRTRSRRRLLRELTGRTPPDGRPAS